MKHCKECKYYKAEYRKFFTPHYNPHKCTHPLSVDVVENVMERYEYFTSCHDMRTNKCGQEAILYKPNLFTKLFK